MTVTDNRPPARTAANGIPRPRTGGGRAGKDPSSVWHVNLLGPVELSYDGARAEVTGQARVLLAVLARTPGEEVRTSEIVASLWSGVAPDDAQTQVAASASRLRKALTAVAPHVDPTSVVGTLPDGYLLAIPVSNVDILAFERLLADARRATAVGQPALALRQVASALALWRGDPYQGLTEDFARSEAHRLEELRLSALESRVDAQLALHAPGVPAGLLDELQGLVTQHWHRERLWAALMTALMRLGRRSDALAAYRRAQDELARRLHVKPGAELRAVEEAVIERDQWLFGVALEPAAVPAALATSEPPCLGREQEVAWLCAALDLAATRRAQARLIVGPTGMGKSRLIAEVAQRSAERGVAIRYWRADARGIEAYVPEPDRLSLVVVEDLDQAQHEDVARVTGFIRSTVNRPVLTLVTCRDAMRVGDLATVPKLVLSTLDNVAVAEIVRAYAPGAAEKSALSAVSLAAGVPGKVHLAASEWAFARAGRRIDRALADSAEPRRTLSALREEVVAGALELGHVRARARSIRPAARTPGCPYPGLAGFGPADVELFHGRERLVAQVLARLAEAPLLAILGDAGSGKTSLLRAGVLPALAAGVLPDSSRWRQVVVTPSTAKNLADLLTPPTRPAPIVPELTRSSPLTTPTALLPTISAATAQRPEGTDDAELADEIPDFVAEVREAPADPPDAPRDGILPSGAFTALTPTAGLPALRLPLARTPAVDLVAPGAVPTVRPAKGEAAADGPGLTLLVVDQFEEAFALLDEAERATFVDAVVGASRTGRVVLSLRSDFYRYLERHPALAELVTANLVPMAAMTEEELRRAIVGPAQVAGLEVEPALVDRLVAQASAGLPNLAVTLRELWHGRSGTTLTLATYESGPGLADAVPAFAESVFARVQARGAARTILAGMCARTEDGLGVRARVSLTDLLSRAGAGALPALDVLSNGGLVAVNRDSDTVQLRHDCLLTEWPRLRDALDDAATQTSLQRHLRRAANAWAANGRPAEAVYHGARLVTVLDWADRHGRDLSRVEREFLGAGQRAALVLESKRRKRMLLLWRWVAGTTALALLATAIAVVSVMMQVRAAATAQRSDAARLGAQALAEPDLRESLLLAIAATRLDAQQGSVLRTVLQRTPDLISVSAPGVTAVATSPDGAAVAVGTGEGRVLLLDSTLTAQATLDYPGHGPVNGLAFTPDGRRLVSWGGSRTGTDAASIVVWDLTQRRPTGSAFGAAWPGAGGGLLADGATLLLAQHGSDPAAPVIPVAWNIDARTPSTAYPLPVSTVDSLVVSPDGSLVAFGTQGDTVLFSPVDGRQWTLPGAVAPLALRPDGRMLLTATGDRVQVWELLDSEWSGPRVVAQPAVAAAWSPDGATFATVGSDGTARLWSSGSLELTRKFDAGPTPLSAVWFSRGGDTLFVVGADEAVLAFDPTGGRGVGAAASDGDLLTAACRLTGRGMTPDEWRAYLPDRPFQQIC